MSFGKSTCVKKIHLSFVGRSSLVGYDTAYAQLSAAVSTFRGKSGLTHVKQGKMRFDEWRADKFLDYAFIEIYFHLAIPTLPK
jgi:hypothetical protein